jgi:hypothetical protein
MKVGDVVGHKPDTLVYLKDEDTWVAPLLRIGLEIEVENPKRAAVSNTELFPFWEFQQDGSLRDRGFEIILAKPLFGKDLTQSLVLAEEFMRTYPLVVNYRTGLHVHADSREMEMVELERFLIIYGLFEVALFNFVGDGRNLNNFCVPWGRVSDHLPSVFSMFEESSAAEDVRQNIEQVERYSALNCNALGKFGSLEFRHMQMSRDFNKIKKWINLIMSIYNASRLSSPFGPLLDKELFMKQASKGGASYVAKLIFPGWFLEFVTDKSIWEGVLLMRDITTTEIGNRPTFGKFSPLSICPVKGPNKGLEIFQKQFSSPFVQGAA